MPVCLHCGEIATEGALFCGKCGYTLPQEGTAPQLAPQVRPSPPVSPRGHVPTPPYGSPSGVTVYPTSGVYAMPVPAAPGAVPPIPPPPSAKYCVRCATLISSAAVYCPVCQQPQP